MLFRLGVDRRWRLHRGARWRRGRNRCRVAAVDSQVLNQGPVGPCWNCWWYVKRRNGRNSRVGKHEERNLTDERLHSWVQCRLVNHHRMMRRILGVELLQQFGHTLDVVSIWLERQIAQNANLPKDYMAAWIEDSAIE